MSCRIIASLVAVGLCATAGCGPDTPQVGVSVSVVRPVGNCGGSTPVASLRSINGARVRLTVVRRARTVGAAPQLVCDKVVRASEGEAGFTLDTSADDWLDLWVEVFNDIAPLKLLARGGAAGINLRPRLGALKVLATPTASFACTPGPMVAARAFHSATALPNGHVLLLGGVTDRAPAGATAGNGQLWAEGTAEVYDPRSGTLRKVSGTLPAPRAFHDAVLLDSPREGPYDLLLLGGVMAKAGNQTVANAGASGSPMPIFPGAGAAPTTSELVRLYPWADPPQLEVLSNPPQLKARLFHTLTATKDGRSVFLGGLYAADVSPLKLANDWELLGKIGSSSHTGAFPLDAGRVGAASAPLTGDKVLVVGGNLGAAKGDLENTVATVITAGTQPSAAKAPLESGASAALRSVAQATLTPGASDELLLAGGLTVEPGKATVVQTNQPLVRLKLVSGKLRATAVTGSGFVPVAYHAATTLPGGDTLLCGGMPAKCPVGTVCGHRHAYRWQGGSGAGLVKEADLRQPRMGHRMTVTAVGNVLISGGLTHDGKTLRALNGVELYGPATTDLFKRAPGKETKSCP